MKQFFSEIQQLYLEFLNFFPEIVQPYVSVVLGVLLVVAILKILKKNFLWLIVLVVLLPASLDILKGVALFLIKILRYLWGDPGAGDSEENAL